MSIFRDTFLIHDLSFQFLLLSNSELCLLSKRPYKYMKLVFHCQDIDTEDTLDLYSMLNFSIMQISLSPLVITAFFEFLHV